jgi:hypothetical protein
MTYGSIVPLIGGETLGMQAAFGGKPSCLFSYSPFAANDTHIVEYYNHEVPYVVLDQTNKIPQIAFDVIGSVCPCAGLSA